MPNQRKVKKPGVKLTPPESTVAAGKPLARRAAVRKSTMIRTTARRMTNV